MVAVAVRAAMVLAAELPEVTLGRPVTAVVIPPLWVSLLVRQRWGTRLTRVSTSAEPRLAAERLNWLFRPIRRICSKVNKSSSSGNNST